MKKIITILGIFVRASLIVLRLAFTRNRAKVVLLQSTVDALEQKLAWTLNN